MSAFFGPIHCAFFLTKKCAGVSIPAIKLLFFFTINSQREPKGDCMAEFTKLFEPGMMVKLSLKTGLLWLPAEPITPHITGWSVPLN